MNKLLLILTSLILISFTNYAFAQFADPLVVLETNQGDIVIEFFHLDAPKHIENFLLLSDTEYYDGILFHRIIPGFMIQSGELMEIQIHGVKVGMELFLIESKQNSIIFNMIEVLFPWQDHLILTVQAHNFS